MSQHYIHPLTTDSIQWLELITEILNFLKLFKFKK